MKTFIKKVWVWLAYSSTNAEKISMTFRGIATMIIPVLLFVLKAYKVNVDDTMLAIGVEGIASAIIVVGGFIGSAMTVVGALRKIWTSIIGTNEVIATFRN